MTDDGKLLFLDRPTTLPVLVERVLQRAIEEDLAEVIVIGMDKSDEFYFAMSESDTDKLMAQLDIAKAMLLNARMKRMGL